MALRLVYTLALITLACAVPHNHDKFHHVQSSWIDRALVRRAETHCFVDDRKANNSLPWGPALLSRSTSSSSRSDALAPSSKTSSLLRQPSTTLSPPPDNTAFPSIALVEVTQGSSVAALTASSLPSMVDLVDLTPSVSSSPAEPSSLLSSAGDVVPSSSGKKGLSYNTASLLSAFSGGDATWAYNWKGAPDGTTPSGVEYVPMVWGLASAEAQAAQAMGASHVLSFNEPDHAAQANMSPQTAAENHIKYLNPLGVAGAQVVSPAITNGASTDPPMGIPWLTAFFQACNDQCRLDAVAFHWYDSASNIEYFKSHVRNVTQTAALAGVHEVWLTEFGASGTENDIVNFIREATSFLDAMGSVKRYAYFMVADGMLVNGNSLSTLGEAYVG